MVMLIVKIMKKSQMSDGRRFIFFFDEEIKR
jgi:hypothetical protein